MRLLLCLGMILVLIACAPRLGPANADFEHQHEAKFIPRMTSELPALGPQDPVQVLNIDALPDGLRKRRSTQGLVADPNDPLNPKKMKRVSYAPVEAAYAYPTLEDAHRVVGEVRVSLRIKYTRVSADKEEITAEEKALNEVAMEVAKEVAREHGANAVARVDTSMKPDGAWWTHPYEERFCRNERKRCVNHWISFVLVSVSAAERVVPQANELLASFKFDGLKALPSFPMKSGKLAANMKRHHCYRMTLALEEDAHVPDGDNLLSILSLFSMHRRVSIDATFDRRQDFGDIGCAAKSGAHDFKVSTYKGLSASSQTKSEPSEFEGMVFQLHERPMSPEEATRYFCGKCREKAQLCARNARCPEIRECLAYNGMSVGACKKELNLF